MKKGLICLVILLSVCAPAFAADLDGMTFEELIDLRERITQEITSRSEWKEVPVPAGIYEIGVDIPEGYWTLTPISGSFSFNYGSKLNESKTDIDWSTIIATGGAASEGDYMSDVFTQRSCSIDMKNSTFLYLTGECLFTPYIQPALGF